MELANASEQTVDVSGWQLHFRDAACGVLTVPHSIPAGRVLEPRQHYLATNVGFTGGVAPDSSFAGDSERLPAAGGAVILSQGSAPAPVVDTVGYGRAAEGCREGAAAPTAPSGSSIERAGGTQDTDDNARDLSVRTPPQPQSRATVDPPPGPEIASARFVPARPRAGQPVRLVVRASDPGLQTANIQVDFGERGGRLGIGACRLRRLSREFALGRATTFRVPFEFRSAGVHTVTVTVSSGGCAGGERSTTQTLSVDVLAARGGDARAAIGARPAQAVEVPPECSGANGRVTARTLRRTRAAILCLTNDARERADLPLLRTSTKLTRAALAHSRDMARRAFFDHVGPGGPTLEQRLRRVRYRRVAIGENIAFRGFPTAVDIMNIWIQSPPHRANILSPLFRFMGTGIVARAPLRGFPVPAATFTVDFGRNR